MGKETSHPVTAGSVGTANGPVLLAEWDNAVTLLQ